MAKQRVCALSDVPPGEVRVMLCGDREVAVTHLDDGVYAVANVCTHDNGPLGEGTLERGRLVCPRHGAAFDPKTGKVLSLPAVRDVKAYEVSVEGDEIYIDCDGDSR